MDKQYRWNESNFSTNKTTQSQKLYEREVLAWCLKALRKDERWASNPRKFHNVGITTEKTLEATSPPRQSHLENSLSCRRDFVGSHI